MKRRHPHLFDLGPREQWETLKRKEKRRGVLEGLPPLPSLLMAFRLQERAASVGFDWPDVNGPAEKVLEELSELRAEAARRTEGPNGGPPSAEVLEEVGDLLFAVVNLSRKLGVAPDNALQLANDKFRRRFSQVEALASQRGLDLHSAGLEALDEIWDEVKASEHKG
jgi:uncharacterized protein YabN with tetrapyrrole methylase and pyrophosphatase domain